MTVLTDYARSLLARTLCGRVPAAPSAVFAALGTGGTAAAGLTGEPVGAGYARQPVAFTGDGVQQNGAALVFSFTAAAGTLTHLGLFDAAAGGNALSWSALSQPVPVPAAGSVTIAAGGLVVSGG
ncbi:hypothetical protein M0638_08565 [Roseomonas sp. NAR14]|uniref:Uncharacterized protein n=1 Tax=Roseomonas acroporae TaxID=2937791 RepID=A0A9X1Y8V7_9PROT|nr:hypothetical protein [Roseomonas acroporae]MCK8784430.1 hypothetical protein [Roseomonas acroporae]